MLTKTLALASLLVALSGCAVVPADAPTYSRAPAAPEGYATVYFYRTNRDIRFRSPDLILDDVRIGELPYQSYTWMHVKAGDHVVQTKWAWDTGMPNLKFDYVLLAGESYYFHLDEKFQSSAAGWNQIRTRTRNAVAPTPRGDAETEILDCCKFYKAERQVFP